MRRSSKGANNANWKGGISKITGFCEECNKEHTWDKWNHKNSKHHFCSRECKIKYYDMSGRNNPNFKNKTVHYNCNYCGIECKAQQREYNRYTFHFCSRECDNKHRIEEKRFSLEKNGRWEGGKSFEFYPLGWTNTFREQIRYRDKYK